MKNVKKYRRMRKSVIRKGKAKGKRGSKRGSRKTGKKTYAKKNKISVKRVGGFKKAVKKVLQGERDVGKYVVRGAFVRQQTSTNRCGVVDEPLNGLHFRVSCFNSRWALMDAHAVLFGARDPNLLNIYSNTSLAPVDEKITVTSQQFDCNVTNNSAIPTMLEVYEFTCIKSTNTNPFGAIVNNSSSPMYDYAKWGINAGATSIALNGGNASFSSIELQDSEVRDFMGPGLTQNWKYAVRNVALNPQQSYHVTKRHGMREFIPASTGLLDDGGRPFQYNPGETHFMYRFYRKMTSDSTGLVGSPPNVTPYGMVFDYKTVYNLAGPINNTAQATSIQKSGKIYRYLNLVPPDFTPPAKYVEPDGDLAVLT